MNNNIAPQFLIYKTDNQDVKVDVLLEDENIWLTQEQMAQLFGKAKSTINEHIKNIFKDGELIESEVIQKFGNSEFQKKAPNYYNLDVIISVGYRVKSIQGVRFRQWATKRLQEYIIKGFTKELSTLNRIVTMYLDYAEHQAQRQIPMTMKDWRKKLNAFLEFNEHDILQNAGKVTAQIAKEFAISEFEKYKVIQDKSYKSDFDRLLGKFDIQG